jgi:hypothetical protein
VPPGGGSATVTGFAWDKRALTAQVGGWEGTGPIAFDYQWRRCTAKGEGCADVPGATGATYTLGTADIGGTLRVVVTASNQAGSATVTSVQSDVVIATPKSPLATKKPSITGGAQVKQVLKVAQGTWTGATPIAYAYQWRRCDPKGQACADIDGATAATYTVTEDDLGETVRVNVTAANVADSVTETTVPTKVVIPLPPVGAAGTASLWHMNELSGTTMTDSLGRSTGKLKSVLVGQPGLLGTGYWFNGHNSLIVVSSNGNLNPGSSPFSVTMHISFTTVPSSSVGDYDLIRKGRSDTLGGEFKMEILQDGKGFCAFKGTLGGAQVSGGPNLADGAWHTISCVKKDSSVSLVVDGHAYSNSGTVGSIANDAPLAIGAKAEGGDPYLGFMDEVGISI